MWFCLLHLTAKHIAYCDYKNSNLITSFLPAGDVAGGLLWGASFYFVSPVDLLLLFLGKIDTERPSDWILRQVGVASGLP